MDNSKAQWKIWVQAARPRTLPASVSPVLLGGSLAYWEYRFDWYGWVLMILCLAVALLAQIASNFANDYFDFKKGADTDERLGPARAVASGWIAPEAMLKATFITLGLACLCGLGVVVMGGWELLLVGIVVALGVLAYSAGPYPLAYNGWGDVCVFIFYGIIPVCFTYYAWIGTISTLVYLLSFAIGFLSVNILVVNNYRDYEQDKVANKRTTIVLFGREFGRNIYLTNGLLAFGNSFPVIMDAAWWVQMLFGLYAVLFYFTWRELYHKDGKELNTTLGKTARNVFLFAILLIMAMWSDNLVNWRLPYL